MLRRVYDYITVDSQSSNLLRLSDSYFLQDAPSQRPARFLMLHGGRLVISGVGT